MSIKKLLVIGIIALTLAPAGAFAFSGCKITDFWGRWMISEEGASMDGNPPLPFNEVGWVVLDRNGLGYGEVFLSVGGIPIPGANTLEGLPLCNARILALDERTCTANAAFDVWDDPSQSYVTRTITLVLNPPNEFRYVSTVGDITILGTAKKSRGKLWDYTENCPQGQ